MATQLFLLDTVSDTHLGTNNLNMIGATAFWTSRILGTARGSGVVASDATATVVGTTLGVEVQKSAVRLEWISPPVSADVTISGTITINIWGRESANSANVAINAAVDVIRANATATRDANTLVRIATSTRTTELGFSGANTVQNFTVTPTSTVVNRGDRLRIRVFGDDAGTMATGQTFQIGYSGSGAAADGDTYVTFTETFAFESAPAGSILYLTDTASDLSATSPALISDFTGSDQNPLSEGGNWANLNSSGSPMQLVSNAASGSAAAACFSYWTPANFGPDLEAYFTVTGTGGFKGIVVRAQQEGGAGTWDGYLVLASTTQMQIARYTNAAATNLASNAAGAISVGDKIGVRCTGNRIEAWRQASGSGVWRLIVSATDTTYPAAGKIGLHATATTGGIDDFYVATNSNLFPVENTAWTSRGGGVVTSVTNTVLGVTPPIQVTNSAGGSGVEWYTPQLTAFTLTGMATANIRALESNALANASLRAEIARVESDGTSPTVWADWCIAPTTTDNGELTTSEVARTCNISGDDLAISDGQRLRLRIYAEDISSAAMGASQTVTVYYAGTSAAASGDTYITLPQSVTQFISSTPGPAFRRQRRASRYLTFR